MERVGSVPEERLDFVFDLISLVIKEAKKSQK
jgi:hypothetical protein